MRIHAFIERYWGERIEELEAEHAKAPGEQEAIYLTYDISAVDFDRLKREFERSRSKRTAVQALKHAVEATRSAVHVAIRDFLYSDETGLPPGPTPTRT